MYIYIFLFFITLGEFVKAKSSKQNQIKNVNNELLMKGHNKNLQIKQKKKMTLYNFSISDLKLHIFTSLHTLSKQRECWYTQTYTCLCANTYKQ